MDGSSNKSINRLLIKQVEMDKQQERISEQKEEDT